MGLLLRITSVAFLVAAANWSTAVAQEGARRVEVVEVNGIIDGSVERAVLATIEAAEREEAELVVLQIDSPGVVDAARVDRMQRAIKDARVPIATWVGPPGARAENGAALLATSGHLRARAPGSVISDHGTFDLRSGEGAFSDLATDVDLVTPAVADLLNEVDGQEVEVDEEAVRLSTDPDEAPIRFHKLDLLGRVLHSAAQPSITFLLLLLALVGIVFEVFHPSTGPAGVAGLAALALSVYGIVTLGGSWIGFALIVAGVAAFCIDLRYESLGPFTFGGLAALIAGSLLLFRSPWLRVSPWILATGIVGMVLFLVGAMTRVLRDLRAVARGELEVTDAHPHPDGQGGRE